jgi:hypothetical protein
MTGRTRELLHNRFFTLSLSLCAGLLLLQAGCATRPMPATVSGPFHKVGNFYLENQRLPPDIRRVALLPLTSAVNDRGSQSGADALQSTLYGEISKARLFETILITPEKLQEWTGRRKWQQNDVLPADFLIRLKEETGCDAVLFSQLSYYRAYPPIAIGWRMLLVRPEGALVWSIDETFDAGEPAVVNSVRKYVLENERTNAEFSNEVRTKPGALWSTKVSGLEWLNSPRQFARYAANAAVSTLSIK